MLYAEEHDSTVQQVGRRNDWLTQMANDSCGEGCAQLDDFKWFLPADERAGELIAPESEIEMSDQTRPIYRRRRRLNISYALRWSLRRDLWRTVTQSCPGDCVGVVMS